MSGLKITFKKFFLSSCEVSSSHLLQSDKMWVYHHRVFSTRAGRVFHCHLPIGMQIWRRVGRARDVSQHISRSWTCKGAFDIWELMKSIWNLYIYDIYIYIYILYRHASLAAFCFGSSLLPNLLLVPIFPFNKQNHPSTSTPPTTHQPTITNLQRFRPVRTMAANGRRKPWAVPICSCASWKP